MGICYSQNKAKIKYVIARNKTKIEMHTRTCILQDNRGYIFKFELSRSQFGGINPANLEG